MLDDLVLHDTTRLQLQNFLSKPSHALLLAGPDGIGKLTVAKALITSLLGIGPHRLEQYPQFAAVNPGASGSISIEEIRNLQKFLQLKTVGKKPIRRAIIIEHAQGMTTEAQNAFLKLLEEPPADTVIVLTVDSPRSLLPTILSRTQLIALSIPAKEQLSGLLKQSNKDETTTRQAYFLSGGLPGLLSALIKGDETHPLLESVTQAKALLQQTPFERLAAVDTLSKQKNSALAIVSSLERIAETGIAQAAVKGETARIKQWHKIRKAAAQANYNLERSANVKLTLSSLFLHL